MITPRFEKESFWLPKGFVLPSKRSPFTMQKESFYNAKGALLFFAMQLEYIYTAIVVYFITFNSCRVILVFLQFLRNPIPHSHGNESQHDAAAGI